MLIDEALRGIRRSDLVGLLVEEAGRLRHQATQVRRVLNTTDPPDGVDVEWWDAQADAVARALDDAALRLERIAHLPPQVAPLDLSAAR